ncbi:cell division protein ZipA [Motilimonas sp. KMU-193]|uniref:cell division protein ZipA n=1 Tax=Motilimonas sp. KMU-193 TaxID=3388668 RepID=UPI00396AF8FC
MQDFRLVLIIVGALAIAALLVHGLWSNHKNKPKSIKDKPVPKVDKSPAQPEMDAQAGFDDDGIGEVRVVSAGASSSQSKAPEQSQVKQHTDFAIDAEVDDIPSFSAVDKAEAPTQSVDASLAQYQSTPASYQPEPNEATLNQPSGNELDWPSVEPTAQPVATQATASVTPEPVEPEAEEEQYITRSPAFKEPYFDEYGRQHYREPQPIKVKVKPTPKVQPQSEPELSPKPVEQAAAPTEPAQSQVEQAYVEQTPSEPAVEVNTPDTNQAEPAGQPNAGEHAAPERQAATSSQKQQSSPAADPQEVFVLNVMSHEGRLFAGAELLPTLLNLGFKFGEMDIFHRHLSPTGNGPVLFSMANMVKPGTFDVDHMEQFETHGVSLFMALPCAGDPSNNFALMLHAAEMLASELDGAVYDATRQPLTRQKVNEYKQRINDFERHNALVN